MCALLRHATALCLVLNLLAGIPAGVDRTVLCVAPNGHVAIEAGTGCCLAIGSFLGAVPDSRASQLVCEGRGDCVDVPLGTSVLTPIHGRGRAPGLLANAGSSLLSLALDVGASSVSARAATSPQVPLYSIHPASRTTILRI